MMLQHDIAAYSIDASERVRCAVGDMLARIDDGGGEGGYQCACPCCDGGTLALAVYPASRKFAIGHSAPFCPAYRMALAELDSMRAGAN